MRLLLALPLALVCACAAPHAQVVLLPGDGSGALAMTTARATQTLQAPYATAAVRADGRVQPGTSTAAAVQARWGAVLGTLPEAGRLTTLHFQTGTTTLTPESQAEVPGLLAQSASRTAVEVLITGHTDQTGSDADNDALSLARAEAVRSILVGQGLQTTFVRVIGRGSRAPLVDAPGQDEPRNRRVEVVVR